MNKTDLSSVTEEQLLLRQLREGDMGSYETLFHRYYPTFFAFARGMLKDAGAAEDIIQNVFMKIWIHREALDETMSIKNYIYVLSKREVFNYLRAKYNTSGKSRALLPPSPLRTVHESFPSYGSSNSIFLFVVRNRLILSTFSFISLVAVVVDKLPYNRTTNRYFVDVPCFCTIYFLAT